MSQVKQINVYAGPGLQPLAELAPALEQLLPVKFVFGATGTEQGAGELIIGDGLKRGSADGMASSSSLHVPQGDAVSSKPVEITVRFADDADVPFPFRGRSVRTKVSSPAKILTANGNTKVLAKSDQGPVWTVSEAQGSRHFKSGFVIPQLPPNGKLNDVLNGAAFLEMFFLVHWLREICPSQFQGPALRASYIIDDPNLHWPSYGHVKYRQIVEHAERENYHVSFATIPLDAWFAHGTAAKLFRDHGDRITLSIHGNDHIKGELGRAYTELERNSLLQHAITRIEALERKTGVRVCRVMVPPHGACSHDMLGAIARNGFEAASISHGSLRAHNESRSWTKILGYRPCELINGCPVMPRWNFAVDSNTVLLAAYFGQTIILRGHQEDLRDGLGVMDRHAQFINSLGNVTWGSLTTLSRMNYQWRMEGNICWLRPMSPKVSFVPPKGAAGLIIDNSGNETWSNWRISGANGTKIEARAGDMISLPENQKCILLAETKPEPINLGQDFARRTPMKAIVRRHLTEARDRVMFWR